MYTGLAVLIIVSLAPVAILLWYFDRLDKGEKESRRFLWQIFLWGILATFIAGGIEYFLDIYFIGIFYNPFIRLFVMAFLFTAVVEESLKYWVIKRKAYDHPAFDEYTDGVVYAVTASLGFAALENVFYVLEGGLYIGMIRAIMSVPAHALFGAIMGYYIALAKFSTNKLDEKAYLKKGLTLAIIFHGLYDFLLLSGTLLAVLVIPMLLGLFINIRRKIQHLHFLDKIKNAKMPAKWTKGQYVKSGIGMVFFTVGVLMLFTVLLYISGDDLAEEVFQGEQIDIWGSSIFIAIMWIISYALLRQKKQSS